MVNWNSFDLKWHVGTQFLFANECFPQVSGIRWYCPFFSLQGQNGFHYFSHCCDKRFDWSNFQKLCLCSLVGGVDLWGHLLLRTAPALVTGAWGSRSVRKPEMNAGARIFSPFLFLVSLGLSRGVVLPTFGVHLFSVKTVWKQISRQAQRCVS